ncbi:hypothetical protein Patl1_21015 [Pistacia atlantica]|uniref:Uncharacterized protein n=1 Tax=Pistacia atlantica TaxID=434234 RepID=A0ACC1BNL0_9ROSI|nr:hypothetical protein Patl1_21015 [Pistacia atlantica]
MLGATPLFVLLAVINAKMLKLSVDHLVLYMEHLGNNLCYIIVSIFWVTIAAPITTSYAHLAECSYLALIQRAKALPPPPPPPPPAPPPEIPLNIEPGGT